MLLDVAVDPKGSLVVTSDRDEKIRYYHKSKFVQVCVDLIIARVSHYPNAYNIANYCLGHADFVSSVSILPEPDSNLLLSSSGDGTLKLWDFEKGEELCSAACSEDEGKGAINAKLKKFGSDIVVAVAVEG